MDTYFLAGEVTPIERMPDSFAILILTEREYIACFLAETRAEQTMPAYYPLPRLLEQSDIHGFSKIERNLYIVSYGCPMEDICGHSINSFLHGRGWEFAHRRVDKMEECPNRVENGGVVIAILRDGVFCLLKGGGEFSSLPWNGNISSVVCCRRSDEMALPCSACLTSDQKQ